MRIELNKSVFLNSLAASMRRHRVPSNVRRRVFACLDDAELIACAGEDCMVFEISIPHLEHHEFIMIFDDIELLVRAPDPIWRADLNSDILDRVPLSSTWEWQSAHH